jgi:hypothetical protein
MKAIFTPASGPLLRSLSASGGEGRGEVVSNRHSALANRKSLAFCLLPFAFCVFFAVSSLAWSARGHKTVGEVAFGLLSNNVRSKVTAILAPHDIQHAAIWPDLLRDVPADDAEMQQFTNAHPDHTSWHFVNLPLKTATYDPSGPFARLNDIVHQINLCIDVLEGQSNALSQQHALRWLVHLVGDLHQPLHVGCGYYRFDNGKTTLLKTPTEATGRKHDRGGNLLHYTKTSNLHHYWDDDLVNRIDSTPGEANLPNIIRSKIKPSTFQTAGPIRTWAAKWAIDSVKEAKGAYSGIQFGEADLQHDGDIDSILIIRPKKYGEKQEPRATRQLAKGAFHLAELLNRIQWQ